MPSSDLVVEREETVVIWRLNRPDRLNAVTMDMYVSLAAAIATAATDSEVRAAILTGTGRGFCVGADLKQHAERDDAFVPDEYIQAGQRANRALQRFPKPTVAAINGHAIGAGLELALSCDFLIAADSAKLRLPELGLGTFVGGGVAYTLAQRVGAAKAKELLLSGETLLGSAAESIGLVTCAVPPDQVVVTAQLRAKELATKAPRSVMLAKDLLDRAPQLSADEVMALEAAALNECMKTEDWREGIAAFHENREPRFTGD